MTLSILNELILQSSDRNKNISSLATYFNICVPLI